MFYQFNDKLTEVEFGNADRSRLAVGFLSGAELAEVAPALGFSASAVQACGSMHKYFRSGVEVYDDYTFTELRIASPDAAREKEDCVALYIKKNLLIVIVMILQIL